MADNILSDFGINILEEEIDDVIFQTNEFLTDATFTGSQGPFWWILQMCMALAALFSIIVGECLHLGFLIRIQEHYDQLLPRLRMQLVRHRPIVVKISRSPDFVDAA